MNINKLKKIKEKSIFVKIELFFYKIINYFSNFKFNLKMKIQRFKKGYASIDYWDITNWFFTYVPKLLKELKKNLHGTPPDLTTEEWINILDEIAEGFEIGKKINDGEAIFLDDFEKFSEENKKKYGSNGKYELVDKQKFEKSFDLFKKWIFNLWD
jgi:hypothetical protein